MTDLKRERALIDELYAGDKGLFYWNDEDTQRIAAALADARREGAEEMRERAKAACHERSQWAASKITNENADAMWATYSNACDDCLYFIAALPLTPEER